MPSGLAAAASVAGPCERPRGGWRTLPLEAAPAAARHVGERARRGRRAAGRGTAARLKAARRTERLPARLRGARVEPGVRRPPPASGGRASPTPHAGRANSGSRARRGCAHVVLEERGEAAGARCGRGTAAPASDIKVALVRHAACGASCRQRRQRRCQEPCAGPHAGGRPANPAQPQAWSVARGAR